MSHTRSQKEKTEHNSAIRDIKEIVSAILSDENIIKEIAKSVSHYISKDLEEIFKKHEDKLRAVDNELHYLKTENKKLKAKINDIEQASKSRNIRIFGIPEGTNENTEKIVVNLFKHNLKLPHFNEHSIEKVYRINHYQETTRQKPRGIFVEFSSYKERQNVIANRKLLKSTGIIIREDMTKHNLELYKDAVKKFTYKSVWIRDGIVFVRGSNGSKSRIDDYDHLEKLTL